MKSLISDIAHQMKTPVATVRMYGELLAEEGVSPEDRQEYVKTLLETLDRLCFLTENMIKMSRLESGIIELKPERTQVTNLIFEAVKQVFTKAEVRKIEISFEPDGEVFVTADAKWTREAVVNILENAIKYTAMGGRISISVLSYEFYAGIEIIDNGIGIPENEKEKIFGRFYRGIRVASTEGIGIGLYITRQIIMEQGGYIKVESDGRTGSTFIIMLPKCM